MNFRELKTSGAFIIELDRHKDERGFFSRSFCTDTFQSLGLHREFVQCNVSYNYHTGTLRGMHFQEAPHGEAKLIRCTRGRIYDVIIDLRKESPTYKQWVATELSDDNYQMLYVPETFAHGFITLTPDTEVFYQMSSRYVPEAAQGIRWDDPEFSISWPLPRPLYISEKDSNYPYYNSFKKLACL